MEELVLCWTKIIRDFASKSCEVTLTEDEALLYHQICNTVRVNARNYELSMRQQACTLEREAIEEEESHQAWLEAQRPKE